MKTAAAVLAICILAGCTSSEERRTRAQARQTTDEVKKEAHEALEKAKVETKKASKELDQGLEKARKNVREVLR